MPSSSQYSRSPDQDAKDGRDSGYAGSVNNDPDKDELINLNDPDLLLNNGLLSVSNGGSLRTSSHHRSLSANSRHLATAEMNQMMYNDNRISLARSIEAATKILRELQEMNRVWPVYYPTTTKTAKDTKGKAKQSEVTNEQQSPPGEEEPRLVAPQQFNIFKLDLKLSGAHENPDIVSTLEKSSVASLLENKIIQTVKHLASLRERINETASKVLITGDLNSGKSTFCNALLRRNLLPTDQQPCTNVFCEVLDAVVNNGVEQVHAVYLSTHYDRNDYGTYKIFDLKELENLVYQSDKYSILKVYIDDKRPKEQSLLRNGVVDIALIDAPGLNMDSYQTTQLFSRQEEIDMVVFVVSAENYFTLSAKDFITAAAHEKSFIFIVVNRFDTIKDKERCTKRIMDQVAELSPETHKDANEFVHFVSSKDVLESRPSQRPDGGDEPDDDNNSPDNLRDFDNLESAFRDFVLEKRAVSKLLPAKTYLNNIFTDLEFLAQVNIQFSTDERDKYIKELDELSPDFEKTVNKSVKIADSIDKDIEKICDQMYEFTAGHIRQTLTDSTQPPSIEYRGVFSSVEYALDCREAIVSRIQKTVEHSEEYARRQTAIAVNSIIALGIEHLGERPEFQKMFREEAMFSRRRDELNKSVATQLDLSDFFDVTLPSLPLWIHWPPMLTLPYFGGDDSKLITDGTVSNTVSSALTFASVVGGGRAIVTSGWAHSAYHAIGWLDYDLLKKLAVPAILAASACTIAYVITDIPNAVPKKLSRKIAKEVEGMGYVHSNSDRISKECRKVLKYPARDVRAGFQSVIERQVKRKEECAGEARKAENGLKYFSKLFRDASEQKILVEKIHIEHVEVD